MPLRLTETDPPASEPLTLAEARLHLRMTSAAEDDLVAALIKTSREICEDYTGLSLVTRGYSFFLDEWPKEGVTLPRPPAASVEGIFIYDAGGGAAAFPADSYAVDAASRPARIVLAAGAAPPAPQAAVNGIEVRYRAGFGGAEDVPAGLKEAMLRLVAHLYSHRGDDVGVLPDSGALALMRPWRVMSLS